MNRRDQRALIESIFVEKLQAYREKRAAGAALEASDVSHDGSVALGKALQTVSLALRLDIITSAEYEAYHARLTVGLPKVDAP